MKIRLDLSNYDFTEVSGRAKFIADHDSNIFTGTNVDGDPVMICLEKDDGMTIKTKHASKPRWWECVEYDKDGYQIGVTYEPAEEDRKESSYAL